MEELDIVTRPVNEEMIEKMVNAFIIFNVIIFLVILFLILSIFTLKKTFKYLSIIGLVIVIGILIWSRNIISSQDFYFGTETTINPINPN